MKDNKNKVKSNKGITIIALVITIVIMLILAAVTIGAINGGLFEYAGKVKEDEKNLEEKKAISTAIILAMGDKTHGKLEKDNLKGKLDKVLGENTTKVYKDGDKIVVEFTKTNSFYEIDDNKNIEKIEVTFDSYPGVYNKDINGNVLTGGKDDPFEINCIEDLCAFSNSSNNGTTFSSKYIVLKRTLDFNSELSYVNGKISVDGKIPSCNSITELQNLLTNKEGKGFYPIESFSGNFNGNYNEIKNIYENHDKSVNQGLFGNIRGGATIQNLTLQGVFKGGNNTGGFAGIANGSLTVKNCINKVNISGANADVGGILAAIYTCSVTIINSSNYGSLSGGRFVAGIEGFDWRNFVYI